MGAVNKETMAPGTLVYTDVYSMYARLCAWGYDLSVSTMGGESTPEIKMEAACVKSMGIPWKGFGLSCGAGCAHIGAFHKKNFLSTSVSSGLFTMPENEAKRASCTH